MVGERKVLKLEEVFEIHFAEKTIYNNAQFLVVKVEETAELINFGLINRRLFDQVNLLNIFDFLFVF